MPALFGAESWRGDVVCRTESGCADGSTEGLQSGRHERLAACDGAWSGRVDNASSLCAAGWTVCGWNALDLLRTLSSRDTSALSGCYAINAAERDGQCGPCYDHVTTLLLLLLFYTKITKHDIEWSLETFILGSKGQRPMSRSRSTCEWGITQFYLPPTRLATN